MSPAHLRRQTVAPHLWLALGLAAACSSSPVAQLNNSVLKLNQTSATFNALAGGSNPSSNFSIVITNGGTGTLGGLTIQSISYGGGESTQWLQAILDSPGAPSVLTLVPTTGTLSEGVHTARVAIVSTAAGADSTPKLVTVTFTIEGFVAIAAGGTHSCGLTKSGVAYCWGYNISGQLGDGSVMTRTAATRVATDLTWQQIGTGNQFSCGLTADSHAYCWGANGSGQLGNSSVDNAMVPTAVSGGLTFQSITVGYAHACGLTAAGAGYCWGANAFGLIGDGTKGTDRRVPTAISGGLTFTSLSAGWYHTCGLISGGVPYCWGQNTNRQLGFATPTNPTSPVLVSGSLPLQSISSGWQYTCGLTLTSTASCWGGFISGSNPVPATLPGGVIGGQNFDVMSVGNSHGCGSTPDGLVYCFATDPAGVLGEGSSVTTSNDLRFRDIVVGEFHKCAIGLDALMYCWGTNSSGQLGDGTLNSHDEPMPVKVP